MTTTTKSAANAVWPNDLHQMGPHTLGVQWSDGHASLYNVRRLRLECRCAVCVDEWTREKKLKDEDVPADVRPQRLVPVGRYALRGVGRAQELFTLDPALV